MSAWFCDAIRIETKTILEISVDAHLSSSSYPCAVSASIRWVSVSDIRVITALLCRASIRKKTLHWEFEGVWTGPFPQATVWAALFPEMCLFTYTACKQAFSEVSDAPERHCIWRELNPSKVARVSLNSFPWALRRMTGLWMKSWGYSRWFYCLFLVFAKNWNGYMLGEWRPIPLEEKTGLTSVPVGSYSYSSIV